jgi:hypothetical protein
MGNCLRRPYKAEIGYTRFAVSYHSTVGGAARSILDHLSVEPESTKSWRISDVAMKHIFTYAGTGVTETLKKKALEP